ncbi:conjugal transfer protein [Nocardia yunnanensis]|uniref:Conjugal transfer protein n=1 Tax=Nocardia yunnanensis TaxID=2382165 RepID=A0A386ZCT7_9NOCA|nr:type IV secretory system conjugative DNA transfer family protein [Nocardia yunnanensis]AYF75298.1 conjugal transfer protein [Nocardia yunnanensis]
MNGDKDPALGNREALGLLIAGGTATGAGTLISLAAHLGYRLDGRATDTLAINPLVLLVTTAAGRVAWPLTATLALVAELLVLAAVTVLAVRWWKAHRPARTWIDAKAKQLAFGADLAPLTESAVTAKATMLGAAVPEDTVPGLSLGIAVADRQQLWADFETLHIDIWGPRQGKSTSRAVPAVCEAPGPVIVTSNKRDLVDDTRGIREKQGRCWIFDPQAVADSDDPNWWWNPLASVRTEVDAAQLASHFADGDDGQSAKKDAFFDPEGESLLAALFLAAAVAGEPITRVYEWISDPDDLQPVRMLEQRWPLIATGLRAQYELDRRTRSGVFATGRKMAASLRLESIRRWVTSDGPADKRPQLDPAALATSRDTLYMLSLEGAGSCGPLVNALTASVLEAATHIGSKQPMGRLSTPLVCVLDEAANVVRWRDLPKRYSHFGSRGILVLTILQSWSQGVRCWGAEGMEALWSASGVRVVGSGVDDNEFLRRRSDSIGDREQLRGTLTRHSGSVSRSWQLTDKRILTLADLTAIPRGRALIWTAGMRPVLVETVPWMRRPYADAVAASRARYGPTQTLTVTTPPDRAGDRRKDGPR